MADASSAGFGYASLASSLVSAIGNAALARTQAKSQKSSLQFQRDMAQVNARNAERSAESVLDQGQQQIGALTMRAGQIKSSQRAAMAANGVALDEGNAVETQASTDLMKEIDMNTIQANAVRSAWGFRMQGVNYANQGVMAGASASAINPGTSAATFLMGSAGSVAQSWYYMNKAGMFNTPSNGSSGGGGTPGFSSGDLGNGLRY